MVRRAWGEGYPGASLWRDRVRLRCYRYVSEARIDGDGRAVAVDAEQAVFIAAVVYMDMVGDKRLTTRKQQHPCNEHYFYVDCSQPIQPAKLLSKTCRQPIRARKVGQYGETIKG
jgi:hypothetical protein